MAPQSEQLSRRERQIMDVTYARGQATAAEVAADLTDSEMQWRAALIEKVRKEGR